MRVAVIVPSYNEADNIAFVTKIIDKGLILASRKFPDITEAIIVNVDNTSSDNTRGIFQKTSTHFNKLSLQTKGQPGKGKNLIYFLHKYSKKYDIFVTLDADLKSIKANWLVKLLEPFFKKSKSCDFVWPLYKRSRFEGSTTNLFAYPIIYSLFKSDVRQPIAGDFAFSQRFAVKILSNIIPAEAYRYGIDILFSIRACQYANYTQQINLGHKIHKPSFFKLENMFPQIAATAIDTINSGVGNILPVRIINHNKSICISSNKKFKHRRQANTLLLKKTEFLAANLKKVAWLDGGIKRKIKAVLGGNKILNNSLWSSILSNWLHYALKKHKNNSLTIAKELLPFFVLRVVSFWNEISPLRASEIESMIKKQAKIIIK